MNRRHILAGRSAASFLLCFCVAMATPAMATTVQGWTACPNWGNNNEVGSYPLPMPVAVGIVAQQGYQPTSVSCNLDPAQPYTRANCLVGVVGSGLPFPYTVTAGPNAAAGHFLSSDGGVARCAMASIVGDGNPRDNQGPCGSSCNSPDQKGNPVNVATGNKFQREVDIVAPSGGGLEFVQRRDEIRRGSDAASRESSRTQSSAGP